MSIPRVYALCCLAAAGVLIAGCGGSTKTITQTSAVSVSATVAAPAPTTTSSSSSSGSSDPVTVKGSTGDTLTLQGAGLGSNGPTTKSKLQVTLTGMRGPFAGFDIAAGKKLIGFDLKIVNVGSVKYSDPLPGGTLTLVGGGTGKSTSLIAVGGKNPCDNPRVNLSPAQSKSVCLAFEVPTSAKPEALQYATDSGYGDTGLWRLDR